MGEYVSNREDGIKSEKFYFSSLFATLLFPYISQLSGEGEFKDRFSIYSVVLLVWMQKYQNRKRRNDKMTS